MGRPDLRHAIGKDYYERLYGYSILPSPEECVTVTLGATEAVASALRTLGRPGDKVVIFEPYHELYPSQCRIFYLDPVFVTLREEEASSCAKGWCFNEIELEHALSSARILILNTPHNPTGKVFSRDELKCIVNLCLKYKVFIVTDEIYEHMVYSSPRNHNKHILIPQEFPEVAHQTFVCNSMGKSASATGWRLGWCVHPFEFSHSYRGVHDQLVVMSPHPIQYAAMTYLRLPKDYFHSTLPSLYVERLGLLSQTLRRVGFQLMSNVDGAYYLFTKYRNVPALTNKKPMEAAMYMTIGVACVPGDNFYGSATASAKEGQEYLRFAACRSLADIQEACQRIETGLLKK
jgi:aspartate/methionine/tyrosine aminotransferase